MVIAMNMEDMKNGKGKIIWTGIIGITMGIWNITIGTAGLVKNNNREKVSLFYEEGRLDKIIIMNFTETWLNSETEVCPEIGGYRLYRGDRSHRKGGGVAIYVKGEFEAQKIAEMSTDEVEMVAVFIEKLNILNIVI